LWTGKPNWRGVQLFRRTNRKMTNVLNNCNCSLFSLCNLCRSISPVIRLPLEDNCNRTFFDLFHLFLSFYTHKLKIFLKSLKSYILTDFIFLIKTLKKLKTIGIFKIAFSSLGFYRFLQRQSWDVGFQGGHLYSPKNGRSCTVIAKHVNSRLNKINVTIQLYTHRTTWQSHKHLRGVAGN